MDKIKRINVLHICAGSNDFGGVENYLYQHYKNIDHNKVHFDFLCCSGNSFRAKEEDAVFSDSSFFFLDIWPEKENKIIYFFRLLKELKSHFRQHSYDIIHVDTGVINIQVLCLIAVRVWTRSKFVSHSHGAPVISNKVKRLFLPLMKTFIVHSSDLLLACSEQAGRSVFGKSGLSSPKYHLMKNAIPAEEFIFKAPKRENIRENMDVGDNEIVYAFIGRLAPVKNPQFLLKVFQGIQRRSENSKLWIIGDGPLGEEIKRQCAEYGLEENVRFWGACNNVPDLMQAADALIFPSVSEGLGLVAIEAQAAGIRVYASNSVPRETDISNLIHYLSLNDTAEYWADFILEDMKDKIERRNMYECILRSGYDVHDTSIALQKYYLELMKRP